MAVELNHRAFKHAEVLIQEGRCVFDDKDMWSEHQPSSEEENQYIEARGFDEYDKWYLGIDPDQDEKTKGCYTFPYGDIRNVHRCGVLAAESRAGQYKYNAVETAASHLHGMIEVTTKRVRSRV